MAIPRGLARPGVLCKFDDKNDDDDDEGDAASSARHNSREGKKLENRGTDACIYSHPRTRAYTGTLTVCFRGCTVVVKKRLEVVRFFGGVWIREEVI